ncbi:DMT family protein [Glaciibacter psychrotolerans]|uniref:Drug/metabolite transporter (DMT)-like permease n=1 Tax=Glaciibacter psychrotolerans TaxID=670054 RepID=A0A7Z0EBK6_9MICO|nr:DMT family transporter [Leifsonia psychrotolerans]NYJ18600.1 drug/metabolite transporter (DMT)-like permease [Leifsonia psychrotolerans]
MSLDVISLTPVQALGIPVALVGSLFLAAGAEFQQHGVAKVHNRATGAPQRSGLALGQLLALARRPSWLIGTLMLGLAIVFQLFSLYLAPLTVVQPLGALALVITAVITARITKTPLSATSIRAIVYCVGGVGLFVAVAALTTTTVPITDAQLGIVVIILASILVALGLAFVLIRTRFTRMFYVVAAGVLFGFVATLAKVLITRVQTIIHGGLHLTPADWLTVACLLGLVTAGILGTYFVQIAYSSGSPELVVAGLTVIDPLVGVTIGIVVLGEATSAPLWAGAVFVIAGLIAVYGVVQLSRQHPQPG